MPNVTAKVVETFVVRAIKFTKDLHTAVDCRARELTLLSLEIRMGFRNRSTTIYFM